MTQKYTSANRYLLLIQQQEEKNSNSNYISFFAWTTFFILDKMSPILLAVLYDESFVIKWRENKENVLDLIRD